MSDEFRRGDVTLTRFWRGEQRYSLHNSDMSYDQLKELGHLIRYIVRKHSESKRHQKRGKQKRVTG